MAIATGGEIDGYLRSLLGEDYFSDNYLAWRLHAAVPDDRARREVADRCMGWMRARDSADNRTTFATLLVGFLPGTGDHVARVVRGTSAAERELQFSVFFAMANAVNRPPAVLRSIERILANYLIELRRDDEQFASWMAAHCLGDHWDGSRAVAVLAEVIRKATTAVGLGRGRRPDRALLAFAAGYADPDRRTLAIAAPSPTMPGDLAGAPAAVGPSGSIAAGHRSGRSGGGSGMRG